MFLDTNFNIVVGSTVFPHTISQAGGGTNGQSNTGLGYYALTANTTGQGNTAIGSNALVADTTGAYNTTLGSGALTLNTTGTNNTVLGYNVASTTLATGTYNILIGTSSAVDTAAAGTNYNLNIGNLLQGDMTNSDATHNKTLYLQSAVAGVNYLQIAGSQAAIGGPVSHASATISGQGSNSIIDIILTPKGAGRVGIGTTSPQATLDVNGYARLTLQSSQPVACAAGNAGAIALNHLAQMCACNGSSWIFADSVGAACSW
jgi:hypothetical protein